MKKHLGWMIPVTVLGLVILWVVGVYNQAIRFENELQASYDNNQNILSNSYYGPMEVAQLGEKKYRDMMLEMVKATNQGYQGATGGKAMMLWLGQSYPNISAELQLKLVSIGEKGLAEFGRSQTDLLNRGIVFKNFLETIPGGFVASMMGFPKKLNLKEILTPVTDSSTEESFKTKKRKSLE